jgi:ferrous iron transport protein A
MDILTARGADLMAAANLPEAGSRTRTATLADLPRGVRAVVAGVGPSVMAEDADLVRRLVEIGFVPGEEVRVIAHGMPGHEPVAVRLGSTTFALRRFEAEYVRVVSEGAPRT